MCHSGQKIKLFSIHAKNIFFSKLLPEMPKKNSLLFHTYFLILFYFISLTSIVVEIPGYFYFYCQNAKNLRKKKKEKRKTFTKKMPK
jgi:hypothetical protein